MVSEPLISSARPALAASATPSPEVTIEPSA